AKRRRWADVSGCAMAASERAGRRIAFASACGERRCRPRARHLRARSLMRSLLLAVIRDHLLAPSSLVALGGVLLTILGLRWYRRLWRALAPARGAEPQLFHYPSLTMVRPIRGCDVGAADNYRAALATGYPGDLETLFIFDDEDDPGLPLARAV